MHFIWRKVGHFALAWLLSISITGRTAGQPLPTPKETPPPREMWWSRRREPLVEVKKACPTIFYELRYATKRNFLGKPVYPRFARCMVRLSVAERLNHAQAELRAQGYGLKVWDAYRPKWAHQILWEKWPDPEVVAEPEKGGSFHSWGASVDVTLVDLHGREQPMPTDFDDFTAAAKSEYVGSDPQIAANVRILRTAMTNAGFKGIRDEWWHFTAVDAMVFNPVNLPLEANGKR
jgi:D-alanyl-D-alanine dipeptidase